MGWLLDPSPLSTLVVAGALLYALGLRLRLATGRRRTELWRRTGLLAAALVLLDLVLSPAFDRYAAESQAMHMLQHVVLMAIVPPLVVLAAPWLTVWRAIPLAARRSTARAVLRLPAGVRGALRGLVSPVVAFVLVSADLAIWHIPGLYDLTLRNATVHDLEHASFLLFGTFYWLALLDSPPLRSRLDNLQRAIYAGAGMVTGSELAGFERHHALRQAHGIVAVMRDVDGWPLNAWGHLSEELIERVLRLPIQGRKRFIEQQN